ncbi:hypothetical protein [Prosthecobacter sp.]|uniref:hypothetical protein n=1 Tax=Prosthecobacter sp. TaxID=1965333 RepID=UPI0037849EE1
MREVLPLAKRMLAENGEFYPYGGITKLDGSIVHVGAREEDTDHPTPTTLVKILRKEFQAQAANQEIEACAIVFDVLIRPPNETEKVDAIQVNLDHKGHYSVEVLFPYLIADGAVTYRTPFAQEGDYSIFGTKENAQAT